MRIDKSGNLGKMPCGRLRGQQDAFPLIGDHGLGLETSDRTSGPPRAVPERLADETWSAGPPTGTSAAGGMKDRVAWSLTPQGVGSMVQFGSTQVPVSELEPAAEAYRQPSPL